MSQKDRGFESHPLRLIYIRLSELPQIPTANNAEGAEGSEFSDPGESGGPEKL